MTSRDERRLVGLDCLRVVTVLLQRVRRAHPRFGLYEAADLQWWWRTPRSTDVVPQLVWFDQSGQPEAAVVATDWGDGRIALDPFVLPDAPAQWVGEVVDRGLAHADELGFDALWLEVDPDDGRLLGALTGHGFEVEDRGLVETWIDVDHRPPISPRPKGYRLASRDQLEDRPSHLVRRSHPDVEARLRQTSLYRQDLDLVALDPQGDVAAYGLFWNDPETATGLVEPMRTEDEHQRRGLARHLLTTGIDRLAAAGARRIKVCYEPGNAASKQLYLSAGFEPARETVVVARR